MVRYKPASSGRQIGKDDAENGGHDGDSVQVSDKPQNNDHEKKASLEDKALVEENAPAEEKASLDYIRCVFVKLIAMLIYSDVAFATVRCVALNSKGLNPKRTPDDARAP
ncbi:hypothetical protein V7S43_004212 [Phytophthora oleae]|uniref:RxLR effector protein n=1 Tax=Phytophthora oleae TaxID=2107226 RepID=A0ABD3FVS8_9STRA